VADAIQGRGRAAGSPHAQPQLLLLLTKLELEERTTLGLERDQSLQGAAQFGARREANGKLAVGPLDTEDPGRGDVMEQLLPLGQLRWVERAGEWQLLAGCWQIGNGTALLLKRLSTSNQSILFVTLYAYRDSTEDFYGYLAYGATEKPLAAGGLRVQRGLTAERIEMLAATMQRKEGILRLNVDGAKCGIDYDPASPGKRDALRRFLRFLAPHLEDRLSLGPDMGTSFDEIEALANQEGIPSVKAAVGRAQGLPEDEVLQRLQILRATAGPLSVGQRRAGHGLAHAALSAARLAGVESRPLTCALQGFGTLARGAALTLHAAGARVTAIADENECIRSDAGLPIPSLLKAPAGAPLGEWAPAGASVAPRGAVLACECDMLLLAACEDALGGADPSTVRAPVVAVGANDGLVPAEYERLGELGIVAVPDLVASAGGSAAMDALFAPLERPSPTAVLEQVAMIVDSLTRQVLGAKRAGATPWEAAMRLASEASVPARARPYGLRVLADEAAVENGPIAIPAEL
jgi:glutamate dehydrogenase (NAD(P)+)